jgi:hypothetical protein
VFLKSAEKGAIIEADGHLRASEAIRDFQERRKIAIFEDGHLSASEAIGDFEEHRKSSNYGHKKKNGNVIFLTHVSCNTSNKD